jgi:outer membrane protein assembly factor BamD
MLPAWHLRRSSLCAAALAAGVLCLLVACASGRGSVPQGTSEPDRFLFENGSAALAKRNWLSAREHFLRLIDGYPQSPYRADAKLGIGDSYLGEGSAESLVLAANEFLEFLTFYPTNRRADYAQFQVAITHFRQMRGPERDQTETRAAVREFDAFFKRYPNSSLTDEARARHREARDRLSDADYRVGLFYYRAGWYPGAVDRFRSVLKEDPEYTRRDAVYFHLAEALVKTEKTAEALPYYERLVQEFAESEYLAETRKRIEQLKAKTG